MSDDLRDRISDAARRSLCITGAEGDKVADAVLAVLAEHGETEYRVADDLSNEVDNLTMTAEQARALVANWPGHRVQARTVITLVGDWQDTGTGESDA